MDGGKESGDVEGLEEDLRGGVAVCTRVEGGFREKDGVLATTEIMSAISSLSSWAFLP